MDKGKGMPLELLSAEQMQSVDRKAVEQGIDSYELMHAAGRAVAQHAISVAKEKLGKSTPSILILAGPGNNGGDGIVAAAVLSESGAKVNLLVSGNKPTPVSDNGRALVAWKGEIQPLYAFEALLKKSEIVIDALFGAGLSRPLSSAFAHMVETVNQSPATVISVDVPSGLNGNTNAVEVPCIFAHSTVTFFRYKPAHFLYPGRQLCGETVLAQIGLDENQLDENAQYCNRNLPELFRGSLPDHDATAHKFDRGHLLVRGGPMQSTGAARLSALTALYTGAGLVTLACNNEALPVNAAHLTAVMLARCNTLKQWKRLLRDSRINIVLLGPGNGLNNTTRLAVLAALTSGKQCVLDADALSCWQYRHKTFLKALSCASTWPILTPHAGEFQRVFADTPVMDGPSKLQQASLAAKLSSSVVIYKGADTVIAAPDGRTAINTNAPPWLATAGAGDVLAGCVAALIAQGMPPFEAACASVWLHGQAGQSLGNPLCAEQLVQQVARELSVFY